MFTQGIIGPNSTNIFTAMSGITIGFAGL